MEPCDALLKMYVKNIAYLRVELNEMIEKLRKNEREQSDLKEKILDILLKRYASKIESIKEE